MAAMQPSYNNSKHQQNEATTLHNMGGDIQYSLDDAIEHIGVGLFQIRLILIVGLAWIADASEMMILSIISPILTCEWNLSVTEEALITVVVFVGMGVGSLFWGMVADKFGRKKGLVISTVVVLIFGASSAGAPSYPWMLMLRFLMGFGMGGVPQGVPIITEMFPLHHRGRAVICMTFFWSFGAVFASVLAILLIRSTSWRYFLLAVSLPVLLFLFFSIWLPESPRYLFTTGKHDLVVENIKQMCSMNGKPLLKGTLSEGEVNKKRGNFTELFTRDWRRTTFLLVVMWCTCAFGYYGVVLLTTSMMQNNINGCHPYQNPSLSRSQNPQFNGSLNPHYNSTSTKLLNTTTNRTTPTPACHELSNHDYINFMWTTTAEFPGIVAALLLIDKAGRRKALAIQFIVGAISFLTLAICTPETASVVFLFIVRGSMTGSFQSIYVYTAEVLPTNIRGVGLGLGSMMARVGAIVTPFVAQVLIKQSFYYVVVVYFLPLLVCVFSALLLKIETQGKVLADSSKSDQLVFSRSDYNEYQSFQ